MRRIPGAWLLAVAVAVMPSFLLKAIPTADEPAAWKGLTPEQIERVKKGEIVLLDKDTSEGGDQERMIEAAMIFDQPIDKAWSVIRRTELQHRYLPDLDNCVLVKRDDKGDLVDFHVKIAMFTIDYRINHHYDDLNCHLWWHLDPGYDNDMKRVDGFWKLYKIDDAHTLARYGTRVEVISIIPDFIMERLTKSNLPVNMEAYYKNVQAGGTYTKPGFEEK
jgi:hypothetical protein